MYAASPGPVDGGFLVDVQIVRLRYTNLRYDECGSVLLQRSSVPVVRRCHTASRLRMVDSWSGKYHSHTLSLPQSDARTGSIPAIQLLGAVYRNTRSLRGVCVFPSHSYWSTTITKGT